MKELVFTAADARAFDQQAQQEFGVSGRVLMENAGRAATDLICELGVSGPVVICCGKGNNGGDGFVIARQLATRGCEAQILMWNDPQELAGDALANYAIADRLELPITFFSGQHDAEQLTDCLKDAEWIVDVLLGTGARGAPRAPLNRVIEQLNDHPARRLAIDLPSGLDCDSGIAEGICFQADHTATFVATKKGFLNSAAATSTGEVHVLDIGVPSVRPAP